MTVTDSPSLNDRAAPATQEEIACSRRTWVRGLLARVGFTRRTISSQTVTNDSIDEFSSSYLFSEYSPRDQRRIAALMSEITVPSGTTLCRQGGYRLQAFIVLHGEAEVRRNGSKLGSLGAGAVFVEVALMRRSRSTTVRAVTPMRLLVMNRAEFRGLLDLSPSIVEKMAATAWCAPGTK